jgi:hypothetical protein
MINERLIDAVNALSPEEQALVLEFIADHPELLRRLGQ